MVGGKRSESMIIYYLIGFLSILLANKNGFFNGLTNVGKIMNVLCVFFAWPFYMSDLLFKIIYKLFKEREK